MKWLLALAVLAGAGAFMFYESYVFVTRHVSDDPFANPRRFFRRAAATFALVCAMWLTIFAESVTQWFDSALWKVSVLATIILLLVFACVMALRDALRTAGIALREQHALQRESAQLFREHLQKSRARAGSQRQNDIDNADESSLNGKEL